LALPSGDATVAARGALADGGAQLLFRDGDGWHDADGRPAEEPRSPGRGRAVTSAVSDDGSRSVAVVHDARLGDDPELLEGVAGMVLADRRREGVRSELAAALEELRQSRRRIAEAADCERARIERDLHDGAQQQLIALRIRLQLAEEKLQQDPTACGADLQELGFAVERAQLELQSLARGVCPPVLMDRGPADALRCLAAEAPMPVHVRSGPLPRQPVAIESAVYFTCAEAVQNALKHAAGASGVTISLGLLRGALCFEVCDDGGGFSAVRRDGRGLANMRDRIEAVGGRLTIASRPGAGTRVAGAVTTT
jgi:signal transduction histidine kinase